MLIDYIIMAVIVQYWFWSSSGLFGISVPAHLPARDAAAVAMPALVLPPRKAGYES